MASKTKPAGKTPETAKQPPTSTTTAEDVLTRFNEASAKFLQTHVAAHESGLQEHAKACLEFQNRALKVEQEAQEALIDATKKHIENSGQKGTGSAEDAFAAISASQKNYDETVQGICADVQAKHTENAQKIFGGSGSAEGVSKVSQDAFKASVAEIQKAWPAAKDSDPQTIKAIASNILFTIQAAGG